MSLKELEKLYVTTILIIKLNIKIVRPFNNFGPGMNIMIKEPADLANAVIKNKNINLFSDGKDTRTFVIFLMQFQVILKYFIMILVVLI